VQPAQERREQQAQQRLPLLVQAAGYLGELQRLGLGVRGLLAPAGLAAVLLEGVAAAAAPEERKPDGAGALQPAGEAAQLPEEQLQAALELLGAGLEAGQLARHVEGALALALAAGTEGQGAAAPGQGRAVLEALEAAGLQQPGGLWDGELEELWGRAVGAATQLCDRLPAAAARALGRAAWLQRVPRGGGGGGGKDAGLQLLASALWRVRV
jgi:hypothetical protein